MTWWAISESGVRYARDPVVVHWGPMLIAIDAGMPFSISRPWREWRGVARVPAAVIELIARTLVHDDDTRLFRAVLLHDALCAAGVSRPLAAGPVFQACREDGAGRFRAIALWLVLGLWGSWR